MLENFFPLFLDLHWQEYVIVLLRNGRRKEEARNELNVFLGDDSSSFVSWYFDLYVNLIGEPVLIEISLSAIIF